MSDFVDYDFSGAIARRPTSYLRKTQQPVDVFIAMGVLHQRIDNLAKYIYETENIYNAKGVELERFGEYASVSRDGMNDDDYLREILMQRALNSASGTPGDIYLAANYITSSSNMRIIDRFCAAYSLHIRDDVTIPVDFSTQLDIYAASGVSTSHTFSRGAGESFLFGGITDKATIVGVNGDGAIGVNGMKYLGVNDTSPVGEENLTGLQARTIYFAVGINGTGAALGYNGAENQAIGINGSIPSGDVLDRGVYLAGTYG
ncbi:hypothetical protein [Pantoea sp. BAV 3049]|uniref:hypothetical protein n=1 Tax=Pantoea sp. BAV 3049 TaxID=2654188 RepID=UPI00131C5106|nr:hypothetical protein [Pantoea sp. BAV 3049]